MLTPDELKPHILHEDPWIRWAALDRFTWALAAEVGRYNIAVNALKPTGVVDTEGMRLWVPEEERHGWVSPARMVACAIFLARQDPSSVTGTVAVDDEYICWHGLRIAEDA